MRPLPSSNGCSVTSHRCASPALISPSSPVGAFTQARKLSISRASRAAGGATKCTRWRCTGPETTSIGPAASSRHAPTRMRATPLYPVGNSAACQPNSRSGVSRAPQRPVASSTIATTPSTCRSTGASAPMSTPSRRAIDERTEATGSASPSMALVLTTSSVSAARLAWPWAAKPTSARRPVSKPCARLTRSSAGASVGKS